MFGTVVDVVRSLRVGFSKPGPCGHSSHPHHPPPLLRTCGYPPPPGAANGRGSTRPSSHVSAGHRPADTATRRAAELLPGPVRQLAAARSVIFASGGRRRRGGRKKFVQASPSLHAMGRPRPTQGKQTRNPFSYEDNLHPNRSKHVDIKDINVYLTSVACCSLTSYETACK